MTKDYTYHNLKDYLDKKGPDFVPVGAIECAHLSARAAVSGDAKAQAAYAKAAIDAMAAFAKAQGYEVALTSADVLGMAVVSLSKGQDAKGSWTLAPEHRYLERLVRFGRAKALKRKAAPAPKATPAPKAAAKAAPASDMDKRMASLEATVAKLAELVIKAVDK